ncbi:FAD-binding domain-containing protein [Tateyamaria omphalii]|uniref:DNA photolyase n=1 Tax=Tateyamaria omphalii TaxID=299262 RepID=A0A1P8MRJ9_9RHOB|nr:FAD-binding domain-containing protein [Tateyamaria omphalii]APX10678.1 DNA photolyase [Tateyamaria omphalii]
MTEALARFPPTRTAALERLNRFVPHAGRDYATRRNYDLGRDGHDGVSTLSPYIRARLLTEADVLEATLARHSASAAEKFIQEVYWRTYWKGWLEMRPAVWGQYKTALKGALDNIQTQSGLRDRWEQACKGETDIECFNAWARELVDTGYMHNHARMWFASIWIFTLRLPWELGAEFFLRHLLDGDPASNTLSWRWVAGIQTPGKTYLARTSNISKYTEGRFAPKWQLAGEAPALSGPSKPATMPLPDADLPIPSARTGLILHDDDLSPGFILDAGIAPLATAVITTRSGVSPLSVAPHVAAFADAAAQDTVDRFDARLGAVSVVAPTSDALAAWASAAGVDQLITPYAPVGPAADVLARFGNLDDTPPLRRIRRPYDSAAWPHATHGFFRFKDKIPKLLGELRGLRAAE